MVSGMPISSDADCKVGIFMDNSVQFIIRKAMTFFVFYVIFIAVIGFLIGYLAVRKIKRTIAVPLNQLAEAAKEYVEDKKNGSDKKEHFKELKIETGDEIEILYYMMTDMERDLNEYEKDLVSVTAERERIGAEIDIATMIQRSMLEDVEPDFVP